MQRRLLLACVWLGALFVIGLSRIAWRTLGFLVADVRRFLLTGGLLVAFQTTDLSALNLAPQIPPLSHGVMAAGVASGALLVGVQGWFCPWSRGLRRRLAGR